jgi:hypothetical protein
MERSISQFSSCVYVGSAVNKRVNLIEVPASSGYLERELPKKAHLVASEATRLF